MSIAATPHPTARALPGPETVTRAVLDNGLIVLVRENRAAPVVVLDGYLPAGAIHDPQGQTGLASFTASMLTRGSAAYDFDAINELVEGVGATLGFSADDHITNVGLTALSEDFPTLLGLLADVVQHPTFPAAHVERVRKQRLVRIQERDEDTQEVAQMAFAAALFGDHPYGKPVIGDAATVATIRRDDLLAFHAARYTPQGAILTVVGDISAAHALELIHRHLGDWRGPAPVLDVPPLSPPPPATVVRRTLADKVQTDLVVGSRVTPRRHPDFFPLRVANTILGRFGMMGRLGAVVREELGLAYYATSSHEAGPVAGSWYALAGVNPAHVDDALDAICAEFARLADEPVADEELDDTQAYLTGILPLQLETNDGVASTLLNMEWHGLGLDYLYHYNDLVRGVTAADVQRVAATYLDPAHRITVIAGPA